MSVLNALRRPFCQWKYKCFFLLTGFLLLLSFMPTSDRITPGQNITNLEHPSEDYTLLKKSPDAPEEKLVHLDLKGAPPRIPYLLKFISFVKEIGATGILLEYEDMFPYKGEIEEISALNAYTLSDIAAIEEAAKQNNIDIIPLIPTLHHFEFVLKLEKFKDFREVDSNPEPLCPSRSGIYAVLQRMIDQVLEVHNNSKYVHIGCDHTELIGVCAKCRSNMRKNKLRKSDLYLGHVGKVARYINRTHPGVRPIIWGNNLVKHTRFALLRHKIPDLVDIALLNYQLNYDSFPSISEMTFYSKLFPHVWVAGSFKGTMGIHKIMPDIDFHLINSRLWKDFIEQWKNEIGFKGIFLTGWQRPSHFEELTELLPVSIPSMAINLQLFRDIRDLDYAILRRSLSCNDFLPVNPNTFSNLEQLDVLRCDFPGYEVYRAVFYFFKSTGLFKRLMKSSNGQYMTFPNVLHGEGKPSYFSNIAIEEYKAFLREVKDLEITISATLAKFYDNYTVNEWIATYVIPLRMYLQVELTALAALVNMKVWPRRPAVNDLALFNAIFNNMCPENDVVKCSFALLPKFVR